MFNKFRRNLTLKYLTITSGFVLLIQLLFGMGSIYWKSRSQLQELESQAKSEAIFLSGFSHEGIITLDFLSLERLIRQSTVDKDILYAVIVNEQLQPMTRYLETESKIIAKTLRDEQIDDVTHQNILNILTKLSEHPHIKEIRQPIEFADQSLGEVYLGYSTRFVERQIRQDFWRMLIISVMISFFMASLTFLLFRFLVRSPINTLDKFAQKLSEGHLEKRITGLETDEFSNVIKTFNHLAKQLQETLEGMAEARDEALAANKAKSDFLAAMSHELRTPLNAVLGMSEALQEEVFGRLNEKQKKALSVVNTSGSHLLKLINDILDLAKIEANEIELEYQTINIRELCKTSLNFVKHQAYKKQIQILIEINPNLPSINLDRRRICQVLINLLNNAVKFTPDRGFIQLQVERRVAQNQKDDNSSQMTKSSNSPGEWIQFSVIDTGIGISDEQQQKLFQPFIQVDSDLNRRYSGTGLGLSLVKKFVELHQGEVGVNSDLGQGSHFWFRLPYVNVDIQSTTNETSSNDPHKSQSSGEAIKPCRVLLAEDNLANVKTISGYLQTKGYTIITAENGRVAIDRAQSENPDIILMDIQMPEVDGLQAIKEIRKIPEVKDIPIIALTALAMNGDREKCLEAGANEYISKPVRLSQLAPTIQQLIKN